MRLTIKTLDQKTFLVDFDETKTVWDLKTHLCKRPEVGVQPEQQQLIYAGRVLSNDNALKTYSIDERKFLVVMAKKAGAETAAKGSPKAEAAPKPAKSPDQPGPSQKSSSSVSKEKAATTSAPVEAKAAPAATQPAPSEPQPSLLQSVEQPPTAALNDDLVANIMNMGYAEADVRRALLASFNNPDRAIEYLIDGIPDVPEMLAQPPESRSDAENPLGFLRNDPRFSQMRRVIQQRPELLSTVLAKIGETNPALLALIRQHQEEFVRMINDGVEPAEVDEPEVVEVVLSDAELLAVERLVDLGFPRDIVVQAYIACEKNEEQTADFLCRHMEEN